jgi:autotransporter-associated beta strand protein
MILGAPVSVAGIIVNDTTPLVLNSDGNTLTLGALGITVNNGSGNPTLSIAAPVVLAGAQSWTNASTNPLTVSGSVNNGGNLLTIAGTGNTAISGAISGPGGVTMAGTGTLKLSAASSYNGTTSVTSGTLIVSGSLTGTGSVSVANPGSALEVDGQVTNAATVALTTGGALRGTGSVGPITSTGGTVEPGLSAADTSVSTGKLTANGDVSLDSASTFSIRLGVAAAASGTDSDVLASTGNVTLGGALNLQLGTNIASAVPGSTFYNIILDGGTLTGKFSNAPATLGFGTITSGIYTFEVIYNSDGTNDGLANQGNDVTLELETVAVPEPGTWAMLLSGAGMLIVWQKGRRRRN